MADRIFSGNIDFNRRDTLFNARQQLDKALAEGKREREYRRINCGENNYPYDDRIPGEIFESIVIASKCEAHCKFSAQWHRQRAAELDEQAEYFGALHYLFGRELDFALRRKKP